MPVIRKEHREQGASATEFALILPILLLLLFGIIEFGIIFFNKAVITNASREGARVGVAFIPDPRTPQADIISTVDNYAKNYLITFGADPGPQVTITPAAPAAIVSGQLVTVDVSYHYDYLLLPGFVSDLAGGITFHGVTTMRAE